MIELTVQQNEIAYAGLLQQPSFRMWTEHEEDLAGLFAALQGYGVTLGGMSMSGGSGPLSEVALVVNVGPSATVTIKLDGFEARIRGFSDADLERLPMLLDTVSGWIRKSSPGTAFKAHLYSYASHSSISQGNSADVLRSLSLVKASEFAKANGHGVILHYVLPDRGWNLGLTIDQSNTITGGFFLQMLVIVPENVVSHAEVLSSARKWLDEALSFYGLKI